MWCLSLCHKGGENMADNMGIKLGVEGEKDFKNALADINRNFRVL